MGQCVLVVLLTALSFTTTGVMSIRCYQCFGGPLSDTRDDDVRLTCAQFDHSAKFVIDCPFSTMCMKQEFELDIQNGVRIKGERRDCAPQKYSYQDYKNGRWSPKYEIMEPYEEGCQNIDENGERITRQRHCYCRSDLCNSSPSSNHEGYTDIMGVIVVFNLMKYINSLR